MPFPEGPVALRKRPKPLLRTSAAKRSLQKRPFLHDDTPIKNDDGESGAGMVIVRMLEREGLKNHIVVVTRWYGGKHLGGDRFRHVQNAVRHYLDNAF